jgi:hypothetical protein
VKPWITYTLIRLGIFAAAFALLYGLLQFHWALAAALAALIGLSVSYLFFSRQRDAAVAALAARAKATSEDELAE